ncbi:Rne/Rng family ribonuclease [Candidatus Methylomirabilis sp.]|uniref:Ribonuclease G n=1 Tax=Candidatus Methylomirabilis tolerans TaxID=3123416 RepID=A0AAJ1AFP7_9BACT|nr:Rne/Rng family ribonuclease [Candidatus Methylomirabilis sp.]
MKREIIVNSSIVETRVAILEDGVLVELLIDDSKNKSIAGNIYKGRVLKILPGMQAAFVDLGLAKDAFLYVRDIFEDVEEYEQLLTIGEDDELTEPLPEEPRPSFSRGRRPQASIEELLKEGQEIVAQVAREPLGTKGARITSHITLPGRYLVYMPTEQHVGVSRKIENEGERSRLKQIIEEINPQREGVIVRTAGVGKGRAEIEADLEFLRSLWNKIKGKAETLAAPALVQKDLDLIFRIFRDLFTKEVVRLVVDNPTEYERCLEYAESLHPDLKSQLFLYTEDEPIFKSFGIEREVEKALRHKAWLKSGGYIVLEETEALVSIDVNTGKYVGKHDFEETVLKTNLEAAREIARQVRLRDLGGIIIIDFIDMARQESRDRVLQELKEVLKPDRSPTNVSLLSELGLVEMTRKRVRQGLNKALSASCPECGGLGYIRSTPSIAHQVLREVEWRLFSKRIPLIRVRAHPDLIDWFRAEAGEVIEALQQTYGGEIILVPEESLAPGKYQLLEG